jgi:hypothetical protein
MRTTLHARGAAVTRQIARSPDRQIPWFQRGRSSGFARRLFRHVLWIVLDWKPDTSITGLCDRGIMERFGPATSNPVPIT